MKASSLNANDEIAEIPDGGERRLANAVILQAWNDFSHEGEVTAERKGQIETARLFFLSPPHSDWGASRRVWCDMANLAESTLVRVAHEKAPHFRAIQAEKWAEYVQAQEEKKMLKRQAKREKAGAA